MPAAIYFLNVLNAAAARYSRGANYFVHIRKTQRESLAMLFLNLHGQGFLAGEIFYGYSSFPWRS
jgi:hypothetical protein